VLLKLYIYGYLNRVQSSRRLEREAFRVVVPLIEGCYKLAILNVSLISTEGNQLSAGGLAGRIADFRAAIRLYPKNSMAFNNRGIAYRMKGDDERAMVDYNEAIRLDQSRGDHKSHALADPNKAIGSVQTTLALSYGAASCTKVWAKRIPRMPILERPRGSTLNKRIPYSRKWGKCSSGN
jgi:tetratricopeptide (TPR) repeat protein